MIAWCLALLVGPVLGAVPPVEMVIGPEPQVVLAGVPEQVEIRFRNRSNQTWAGRVSRRIFQASSATAMPVGEVCGVRPLTIPARQTVLEQVALTFPTVRAETRFLVKWFVDDVPVAGATAVSAIPTNALQELEALAGDAGLGLLDPHDRLSGAFERAGVRFAKLGLRDLDCYQGKLAFLCTDDLTPTESSGLKKSLRKLLAGGANVLWFHGAESERDEPSITCWRTGAAGTLITVPGPPGLGAALSGGEQKRLVALTRFVVSIDRHTPVQAIR